MLGSVERGVWAKEREMLSDLCKDLGLQSCQSLLCNCFETLEMLAAFIGLLHCFNVDTLVARF